jgi:hypothetical protein
VRSAPDLRDVAGQPGAVRERRATARGDRVRQRQPADDPGAGHGDECQVQDAEAALAATDRVAEHDEAAEGLDRQDGQAPAPSARPVARCGDDADHRPDEPRAAVRDGPSGAHVPQVGQGSSGGQQGPERRGDDDERADVQVDVHLVTPPTKRWPDRGRHPTVEGT